MATHSSILAWKIPWVEEPGRLQSMGLLRIGKDFRTSFPMVVTSSARTSVHSGSTPTVFSGMRLTTVKDMLTISSRI